MPKKGFKRCPGCKQRKPAEFLMSDPRFSPLTVTFCASCAHILLAKHTFYCCRCGTGYVSTWKSDGLCALCRIQDKETIQRRLKDARRRSLKMGLSATLTIDEWMKTLHYFRGMCAYCLLRPYEDLEHFVPEVAGGETSKHNCVPACAACNTLKRSHLPAEAARKYPHFKDSLRRVAAYLEYEAISEIR